ncbi:MAG: hypothetical protein ABI091_05695 [Ferruginibacter sp.]
MKRLFVIVSIVISGCAEMHSGISVFMTILLFIAVPIFLIGGFAGVLRKKNDKSEESWFILIVVIAFILVLFLGKSCTN